MQCFPTSFFMETPIYSVRAVCAPIRFQELGKFVKRFMRCRMEFKQYWHNKLNKLFQAGRFNWLGYPRKYFYSAIATFPYGVWINKSRIVLIWYESNLLRWLNNSRCIECTLQRAIEAENVIKSKFVLGDHCKIPSASLHLKMLQTFFYIKIEI